MVMCCNFILPKTFSLRILTFVSLLISILISSFIRAFTAPDVHEGG